MNHLSFDASSGCGARKKPPGGRRFPPGDHAAADSLQRRIGRANLIVNVDLAIQAASDSRDTLTRLDAAQHHDRLVDQTPAIGKATDDLGV